MSSLTKFRYETDLLGNMQSILSGLQGYDVLALELIQNADDAGAESLEFDIDDDALRLRNDRPFTSCGLAHQTCAWEADAPDAAAGHRCDFHAIMRVGGRNKVAQDEMIGRFGIGFISVFQVTDAPRIRSGPHEIVLTPINGDIARHAIPPLEGAEFELPWAKTLTPTRRALNASPVPSDAAQKMADALQGVAQRGLIFLRTLSRLTVRRNGSPIGVTTVRRESGRAVVESTGQAPVEWLMLRGDAAPEIAPLTARYETLGRLGRRTDICLAIPANPPATFRGLLYAYLPTEQLSGLPLHINGDFFPHPNRRAVVLSGESHERYFNEALLHAAARLLGENLLRLRDALGAPRLWGILDAAFDKEEQRQLFWDALRPLASGAAIALIGGGWLTPAQTFLPGAGLTPAEEADATTLGAPLLDSALRPFRNTLANLGAQPFTLARLLPVLTAWLTQAAPSSATELAPAWRLVEALLPTLTDPPVGAEVMTQVAALPFVVDAAGEVSTLQALYRRPASPAAARVRDFDLGAPFAADALESFPRLAALLDPFTAADLARYVAEAIETPQAAAQVIGAERPRIGTFFEIFAELTAHAPDTAKVRTTLWTCPLLPGGGGFVTPAEAVFPSDFVDPLNRFTSVDKLALGAAGEAFVRNVLGVRALSFATYVEEHLAEAVAEGLKPDEYRRLLTELVRHHAPLFAAGLGERLAEIPLARNRAGEQVEPRHVYRRRPDLVALFGDDPGLWLDEAAISGAMPLGALEFFERLGMPRDPLVEHLVARIEELVEASPTDTSLTALYAVVRHLLDRFERMDEAEREALEPLRWLDWIPASLGGQLDRKGWFAANAVYQPFRAPGFDSQAHVVDLPGLRQHAHGQAFLAFLDVAAEPPTEVIVYHLLHCMTAGLEPNDITYAMLNERANQPAERPALEPLRDRDFIFDRDRKRFVSARQVFWQRPPLGARWSQASSRMTLMDTLYRGLGVKDAPEAQDYADLVVAIARDHGDDPASTTTALEVEHCLNAIAQALVEDAPGQVQVLATLMAAPCLLTFARTFAYPEEVAWADAPWLAEPFDGDLDRLLVPPLADRGLAQRLFEYLNVRPLSEAVRLRAQSAANPVPDPAAGEALLSRIDLILQLAPSAAIAANLRERLRGLAIVRTTTLMERGEFTCEGEPIVSKARATDAFYDTDQDQLILRGQTSDPVDWSQALKALFLPLTIGARTDLRQLVLSAAYVVTAATHDQAERSLIDLGYEPWSEAEMLAEGGQLADLEATQDARDLEPVADEVEPQAVGKEAAEPEADNREPAAAAESDPSFPAPNPQPSSPLPSPGPGPETRERERSARTSRMLSYVAPRTPQPDAAPPVSSSGPAGFEIDEAAMTAVLKYEARKGRLAERKAHNHPGYDVTSAEADGETRLIEVKGLEGAWTVRGVKLTSTQFATAQKNLDRYWLYVVEFALDPAKQQVHAICNPFDKVQEYWFDHGWRDIAEDAVHGVELNAVPGGKVRHELWGPGEIITVRKVNGVVELMVEFGAGNGRKSLSINKLQLVA